MSERTKIDTLSAQLESIWADFDTLFAHLDAAGWQRRHGPDWVFADVPYHLAYFDRFIARYLEAGNDLPTDEQLQLDSISAMARWNGEQFALRPPSQSGPEAVADMHLARDRIRALIAGMTDDDLSRPAWMSLTFFRGWRTIETVLLVCLMHTWNEFIQLKIHMGRDAPIPDPAITHLALGGFLLGAHSLLDKKAAAEHPMVVRFVIDGPGGGAWTVHLTGDGVAIQEGHTAEPDLIFEQSVETFMKTFNGMHDPAQAMQDGEIRAQGMEQLPAYAQLVPPPTPDTRFEAFPTGT